MPLRTEIHSKKILFYWYVLQSPCAGLDGRGCLCKVQHFVTLILYQNKGNFDVRGRQFCFIVADSDLGGGIERSHYGVAPPPHTLFLSADTV